MTNPPKGLKNDPMKAFNEALAAAKPVSSAEAAYPLEVRFTAEGESTHLTHVTGQFETYWDAKIAEFAIGQVPGIRMVCIFDGDGRPVA